ncbi:MAG: hypothetical protein JXB32_08215 [Deltaproteobacteria bacterium]|nr:hypothetical protein [Deltaproteobacteria bacterium]
MHVALAALAALAAACSDPSPGSLCDGVTCSGHGYCVTDGVWPVCVCEPGYRPSGTSCVSDSDAADVPVEADGGTDRDAEPDGVVGTLIVLHGYELEFAVNVDALDRSRVRFYGGFSRAPGIAAVTNARVTSFAIVGTDATREALDPQPPGGGALDPLPLAQQQIFADLVATEDEAALCVGATPALHRGAAGTHDFVVRLAGTSSQGDWTAEASVEGDDVLLTCHAGLSRIGSGTASLVRFPDPVGDSTDLSVVVDLLAAPTSDTVVLGSFVLAAEGLTETFTVPAGATASPCDGGRACIVLRYTGTELIPGTLCPALPALPPQIYFLYSGSLDPSSTSGDFSGAAPAGQCQSMLDAP